MMIDERCSDPIVEARALAMDHAELARLVGYWAKGSQTIEACLTAAKTADPLDIPMPIDPKYAPIWHTARQEAFRHSLEMMGFSSELTTA